MKTTNSHFRLFIAAAIAIGSFYLIGCSSGSSTTDGSQQMSVETAQTMRSIFDKANGNYEALSAADKATYIKLSGSEALAKQNWELMKNGPAKPADPSTAGK